MKKLLRRLNSWLTKWLDDDQSEEDALGLLDLVFEWHKVPGSISFVSWLAKQVLESRASKHSILEDGKQ